MWSTCSSGTACCREKSHILPRRTKHGRVRPTADKNSRRAAARKFDRMASVHANLKSRPASTAMKRPGRRVLNRSVHAPTSSSETRPPCAWPPPRAEPRHPQPPTALHRRSARPFPSVAARGALPNPVGHSSFGFPQVPALVAPAPPREIETMATERRDHGGSGVSSCRLRGTRLRLRCGGVRRRVRGRKFRPLSETPPCRSWPSD